VTAAFEDEPRDPLCGERRCRTPDAGRARIAHDDAQSDEAREAVRDALDGAPAPRA